MIFPILDRIMIKPDNILEADEVVRRARAAGLEVSLDKREQAAIEIGTVVSVGSTAYHSYGTTAEEQGIVPGVKVIFVKYAGKTIKDGPETYLFLNDEDIVGISKE